MKDGVIRNAKVSKSVITMGISEAQFRKKAILHPVPSSGTNRQNGDISFPSVCFKRSVRQSDMMFYSHN